MVKYRYVISELQDQKLLLAVSLTAMMENTNTGLAEVKLGVEMRRGRSTISLFYKSIYL